MTAPKTIALFLAAVGAAALLVWANDAPESTEHLQDKIWVERVPDDPREMVDWMVFVDRGIGVVAKSSLYRLEFDFVGYAAVENGLRIEWMQKNETSRHAVRTWPCEGEGPTADFEWCMDFDGRRFYGRSLDDDDALAGPNVKALLSAIR